MTKRTTTTTVGDGRLAVHLRRVERSYRRAQLSMLVALVAFATAARLVAASDSRTIEFNRDIRPILSAKCFRCHGPDPGKREANLRLDQEASAKAVHGDHTIISSGKVEDSELVRRITSTDESERMPPPDSDKQLTADEIKLLQQWIAAGAKWELAWAYVSPKRQQLPKVEDSSWPVNWIDNFVLARLEAEGVTPSPATDTTTLVRRLYVDLTGIPPTPNEVARFANDESSNAYERLVDRLLDSPRYGERMAMYWLDLVRFADTVGYEGDQVHHITPYRDYVISAFNRNLPFDQFTREQLAGDLLPAPTLEQTIATGYNRLLRTSTEGGVQPKQYLAIYGADRVRNVSAVWMAGTMGCAQCHDHKYDPFTAKDFYSLQAFFADIDEAEHLYHSLDVTPTTRSPEIVVHSPSEAAELLAFKSQLIDLDGRLSAPRRRANASGRDAEAADSDKDDLAKSQSPELKKEKEAVQSRIKKLEGNGRKTMITVAIKPRPIRILPRGDWMNDTGPIVEPAVPEFLGKVPASGRQANRLDLANWLTDTKRGIGGLTARVMANRFWYLLFGRGISSALEDFGAQGEPPDTPQLLDALAVEFSESGWDIKHMMKLIVMSRAYQQASVEPPALHERDPLNRLVARQASYRFQAETVRDTALAISGLLVEQVGGTSAHPYQPAGYYRHLNFPKREYHHDSDAAQWRRGVYVHWQRQFLHPMLKAFDAPAREECTAQRPRSNTPLAALVLLNDPSFVEAARGLAQRMLFEPSDSIDERLDFGFRLAVSRSPDTEERRLLVALLKSSQKKYAADPAAADALLAVGLSPPPEKLNHIELASWTIVARAILSMNETLTRN